MDEGKFFIRFLASIVFAVLAFSFAACNAANQTTRNAPENKNEITVSAAASLQNAFREIGAEFEKQTGARVNFNFASSGVLQKQIEQGAPVDVFASAGEKQMQELIKQDLVAESGYVNFVRNELVLIAANNTESKITGFVEFLENKNARLAVGNPKTVPAGQYAQQSLERLGLWQKLQPRLILAEDVRQVLDYVARGEVEAGIVYDTDVRIAKDKVREIARAPENSHDRIYYPIGIIKSSRQQDLAVEFVKFVRREKGSQILGKHGFTVLE